MSFLGDAFSIPAAKPVDSNIAKKAAAPEPASNQSAGAQTAQLPEVLAEDFAVQSTDAAVQAASSKVMITPPLPGQEPVMGMPLLDASEGGGESVVTVTEKAAKEVHRIVDEQKLPGGTGLRLGVQGGGCSGFSYKLAFETMKAPLDWEGESSGIKIYIDPKSFLYLAGIELDFQDSLMGRGFVFNNPNAKKTCGCGESFTV
ncbi:MAG: HesB/IscA family protein, partial [Planctomycetota bacterium]